MIIVQLIMSASMCGLVFGFEATSHMSIAQTLHVKPSIFRSVSPVFYRDDFRTEADAKLSRSPSRNQNVDVLAAIEDQSEIDEYLEFLDRRYNRLRGESRERSISSSIVYPESVVSSPNDSVTCNENEDALSALGVAGLASRRLRQKFEKMYHPTVVPGNSMVVPTATLLMAGGVPSVRTLSIVWASTLSVANVFVLLQRRLVKNQNNRLFTLVTFLSKDVNFDAARSARAVWRMGGGKNNLSWTLAVMSALFMLLLKPISLAMANKATMA